MRALRRFFLKKNSAHIAAINKAIEPINACPESAINKAIIAVIN